MAWSRARAGSRKQDCWNDWVSAMVEYDLGDFGKSELKDAYFRFEPGKHVGITLGQYKRRFDLFELTSTGRYTFLLHIDGAAVGAAQLNVRQGSVA